MSVKDNVYTTKCSSSLIVDVLGMGVDLTKAYSAKRIFIRFSINRRLIVGLESKTGALGGYVLKCNINTSKASSLKGVGQFGAKY